MERITLRASCALLVVWGSGCATAPPPRAAAAATPAEDDLALSPPKIRIVDPQLAAARSASHEVVTVPFAPDQKGTEVVYALLDRAGQEGARYVADLKMYMTFRFKGTPVECRTSVMLEGDPRLAAAATRDAAGAAGPYATDVTAYQPQKVDFVAEDHELACRKVRVARNKWKRASDTGRDVETARLRRIPVDARELVTTIEDGERCEWKPVTRAGTRYDYEVKLGFVPPNWDHLQARFARRKLVPAAPTCYALAEEELAKQPMYRVTATAYRRGKVAQRLPDTLPSMAQINPSNDDRALMEALSRDDACG